MSSSYMPACLLPGAHTSAGVLDEGGSEDTEGWTEETVGTAHCLPCRRPGLGMGVEHGGSRILPSGGCWHRRRWVVAGSCLPLGGQSQLHSSRSHLPWGPGLGTSYLPFPVPSGAPGASMREPCDQCGTTWDKCGPA